MTPGAQKHRPTAGALRAASKILQDTSLLASLPELIDQETGVREVLEILENIIAEVGDLIESRSSERVPQARAGLRRSDEVPRQAERQRRFCGNAEQTTSAPGRHLSRTKRIGAKRIGRPFLLGTESDTILAN